MHTNVRFWCELNRSKQHYSAGALWRGPETILPLTANILDIALFPEHSGNVRPDWPLFQRFHSLAFCYGVKDILAHPFVCIPFRRTGLEWNGVASIR